jgi:hypothetical protein
LVSGKLVIGESNPCAVDLSAAHGFDFGNRQGIGNPRLSTWKPCGLGASPNGLPRTEQVASAPRRTGLILIKKNG